MVFATAPDRWNAHGSKVNSRSRSFEGATAWQASVHIPRLALTAPRRPTIRCEGALKYNALWADFSYDKTVLNHTYAPIASRPHAYSETTDTSNTPFSPIKLFFTSSSTALSTPRIMSASRSLLISSPFCASPLSGVTVPSS